jgi:hypothetical protein
VDAHGVRVIENITNTKQNYLHKKEVRPMSLLNKELLAPREITAKEVTDLVDEFVQAGGKIKVYPSSSALNFRADAVGDTDAEKATKLRRPRKARKK